MIESEVLLEQVAWTSHTCLEACCQARQILLLQLLTPISLEGLKFESSKSTFDIIHGDSRNSQSFDKMRWPTACCECPAKFVRFLHVLWCCSGSLHIKTTDRIYRSMRAETDGSTLATSSMAKQAAVKPRSTPPMSAGTFTDSRLLQHVCWQHFSQQQKHGNFWRVVVICTLCNLWTSPRLDSHEALLKHSIHDLFVHGTLLVHGLDDWNSVGKVQPFQVTLPTLRISPSWIDKDLKSDPNIFPMWSEMFGKFIQKTTLWRFFPPGREVPGFPWRSVRQSHVASPHPPTARRAMDALGPWPKHDDLFISLHPSTSRWHDENMITNQDLVGDQRKV